MCNLTSNGTCNCECPSGFDGDCCENDIVLCTPGYCSNGGTCTDGIGDHFYCVCPPEFTGEQCQEAVCTPNICHNGTCSILESLHNCDCLAGYAGVYCENDLNFCDDDTCGNGGTCEEGPGTSTNCWCPPGFSGATCEVVNCTGYCMNEGKCNSTLLSFPVCTCPVKYSGDRCELPMNPCTTSNDLCENGGTCIDSEGYGLNFTCECPLYYSGQRCEHVQHICDRTNPCANGGICSSGLGLNNYTCSCPDGFGGKNCSEDRNYCDVINPSFCHSCREGTGAVVHCSSCPHTICNCGNDSCAPNNCTRELTNADIVICGCLAASNLEACSEGNHPEVWCNCTDPHQSGVSLGLIIGLPVGLTIVVLVVLISLLVIFLYKIYTRTNKTTPL